MRCGSRRRYVGATVWNSTATANAGLTKRSLPRRWVNNGFDGWSGRAQLAWPEQGLALTLRASPELTRSFVFRADRGFDRDAHETYFCFEPMTHDADGHARLVGSGLKTLAHGETLAAWLDLRWSRLNLEQ